MKNYPGVDAYLPEVAKVLARIGGPGQQNLPAE